MNKGNMAEVKRKVIYILLSIFYSFGFAYLTILTYSLIANRNVLIATILNLGLIAIFVIFNKLEDFWAKKLLKKEKESGKLNILFKSLKWYLGGPSFKSSLYVFYIVVLVGVAILVADPYTYFLQNFRGYLLSVQYGILFLIATDKFLDSIMKDIKRDDKAIKEIEESCKNEDDENDTISD